MILKQLNPIARKGLRFFLYALFTGALVLLVTWEAMHHPKADLFHEDSILEGLQAAILFFTAACAYLAGHLDTSEKPLTSVLVGAAGIAAVREFDFALDRYVFDGAWQALVTAIAISTAIHAYQNRQALKDAILDFLNRPSFGIMASGFITVFVFSRLIGRQVLWKAIMSDEYMRVVKIAVEESFELLGYSLIFIGALEFLRETLLRKDNATQPQTDAPLSSPTAQGDNPPVSIGHIPTHTP
ncbi:hypothetical protein DSLASN_45920 [Desulfoluna limicola]|uniref:Uncharacterized protein n=1 Tax=Desulfoluna limicola TaxID=2810562 RepID=A0ABN6FDM6_9BACT|nr:hypothetical protein [Desulfoluna limicola]BCS98960.1 hypothetical protein DSLASN_45920 [Desulfoluna limicola]